MVSHYYNRLLFQSTICKIVDVVFYIPIFNQQPVMLQLYFTIWQILLNIDVRLFNTTFRVASMFELQRFSAHKLIYKSTEKLVSPIERV